MARLLVILAFVALALTIFTVVDVARIEDDRVRALRKPLWLLIVILLPVVGAVLWFLIGRARAGSGGSGARRPVAPDDDPAFLGRLGRDHEQEERIRRLEQELAELDDDPPKD